MKSEVLNLLSGKNKKAAEWLEVFYNTFPGATHWQSPLSIHIFFWMDVCLPPM